MKKNLVRDNQRKLHGNPPQHKAAHSQSPTHKKLIRKIELTQRQAPNQYEHSLQENTLFSKPQEEVVDFRVEIERRYHRAIANQTFRFPLKNQKGDDSMDDSQASSSHDSSFESLRHVTVYDLASQNTIRHKPKAVLRAVNEHLFDTKIADSPTKEKEQRFFAQPEQEGDSSAGLDRSSMKSSIEAKINDKTSYEYRSLMSILEKHLNKDPNAIQPLVPEKPIVLKTSESLENKVMSTEFFRQPVAPSELKRDTKDKRASANLTSKKTNLLRDDSQKSIGYYVAKNREANGRVTERTEPGLSFQEGIEKIKSKIKALESSQRSKIHQSRDKGPLYTEESQGGSDSVMSLESRLSPGMKKSNEANRALLQQDPKKKMNYIAGSSSVLKTLTPKYLATKNTLSWKEVPENKLQRLSTHEDTSLPVNPMSGSLYQKVQDDVMNGKMLSGAQKLQKKKQGLDEGSDNFRDRKTDMLKTTTAKASNFIDFYGSPRIQSIKSSQTNAQNIYQSFSKGRELRKLNTDGMINKSTERHNGYVSHDFSDRQMVKPSFKLDFSARLQKQRELLSTNRGNVSKEKSVDMFSIDSILKNSYDMQNYSMGLNTSKQAGESTTKRKFIK